MVAKSIKSCLVKLQLLVAVSNVATWLRGTDASPAALVQALKSAGMIGLAERLAVKYGKKNLYTMHDI